MGTSHDPIQQRHDIENAKVPIPLTSTQMATKQSRQADVGKSELMTHEYQASAHSNDFLRNQTCDRTTKQPLQGQRLNPQTLFRIVIQSRRVQTKPPDGVTAHSPKRGGQAPWRSRCHGVVESDRSQSPLLQQAVSRPYLVGLRTVLREPLRSRIR